MAEDLNRVFPEIEVQFVEGSGGVFDVFLGQKLLFSKHHEYRFPDSEEIIAAIRAEL